MRAFSQTGTRTMDVSPYASDLNDAEWELLKPLIARGHPAGRRPFEKNARGLLVDQDGLAAIVLPMLEAWRGLRIRAAELGRQLVAGARQTQACRILMSIPGVGAITATSLATAIEDPDNFKRSRSVGACLGLTTRRYQSGEVNYDGHISRRGDL
jgi:transposase